jgi:hypothetical protein
MQTIRKNVVYAAFLGFAVYSVNVVVADAGRLLE